MTLANVGQRCSKHMLIVGIDWIGNPMAAVVPRGYEVSGLVLATLLAAFANAVVVLYRYELIGGQRQVGLVRVDGLGNLLR